MKSRCFDLILAIFILFFISAQAHSLPELNEIVSGSAELIREDNTLTIDVHTDKLIANYDSFSIAPSETVTFIQPSSNSIALNRVVGVDPSSIFGALTANGKIMLINPNGILFGPNSRVDVAGLVASTLNISNEDFLAGRYVFYGQGGNVINQGRISAPGSYITLLGSSVENAGIIEASLGSVVLASGEVVTLDLDPQGLISVVIDEATTQNLQQKDDAVKNTGTIVADGGVVILTARVLDTVFDRAINNQGVIEADAIEDKDGMVKLVANQRVAIGGVINAEGGIVSVDSQGADFSGTINCQVGTYNMNDGDTNLSGTYVGDQSFSDNGDITVVNDLTVTDGSLSLLAGNNITVNKSVNVSSGDVRLFADSDNNNKGELIIKKGVTVTVGENSCHYLQGSNNFKLNSGYLTKLIGGNYLYVKSTNGKVEIAQPTSKSEGIELYAAGDLKVSSNISSDKDIRLYADNDNNQSGNLIFGSVTATAGTNYGHYLKGSNVFTLDSTYLNKLVGGDYLYVKSTKDTVSTTQDISKSLGVELYTPMDLTVNSNITASSGSIILQADSDNSGVGKFIQADSTLVSAGEDITISSSGDTTVKNISAGDDINITVTSGSILDDDDDSTLISGDLLTLTASSGIGTNTATGDLDTQAASIDASVAATGAIYITESDNVTLTDIDTSDGSINITAGGAITATDDVVAGGSGDIALTTTGSNNDIICSGNITAISDTVTLSAAGDIIDTTNENSYIWTDTLIIINANNVGSSGDNNELDTRIRYLEVDNVGGALYIKEVTDGGALGLRNIATNGLIDIEASGNITLYGSYTIIADGDIILTTTGGNLTFNADSSILSNGGDITVASYGDVKLALLDAGGGDVSITSSAGSILDNDLRSMPADYDIKCYNLTLDASGDIGAAGAGEEIDLDCSGTITENKSPNAATDLNGDPEIETWSNDNTIYVSWTAATDPNYYTGSGIAGYSYVWDTSVDTDPDAIADGSGTSTTSLALTDGSSHYFHIRSLDKSGNASTTTHLGPFFIDTTSPIITITAPSSGTYSSQQTLAYSVSDNLDSNPAIDGPSSGTVYNTAGTYSVLITATDSAGNRSSASVDFTIQSKDYLLVNNVASSRFFDDTPLFVENHKVNSFNPTPNLYFYHPISSVDNSAISDIILDVDMYEFIEGSLKTKKSLPAYYHPDF